MKKKARVTTQEKHTMKEKKFLYAEEGGGE